MNSKNHYRHLTVVTLIVIVIFGTGCGCFQNTVIENKNVEVGTDLLALAEAIASIYPKSSVVMSEQHTIMQSDNITAAWFIRINSTSQAIADFYLQKLEADEWQVDYQAISLRSGNLELFKPGLILQIWLAAAPIEGQTNVSIILARAEMEN